MVEDMTKVNHQHALRWSAGGHLPVIRCRTGRALRGRFLPGSYTRPSTFKTT